MKGVSRSSIMVLLLGKDKYIAGGIQPVYIQIRSQALHPLHRSSAIISFHWLINWALFGICICQSAFPYQSSQMAGCSGRCEIAKLFEASAGEILVGLKIIYEQGIYFINVKYGGTMLVCGTGEYRFLGQFVFQ